MTGLEASAVFLITGSSRGIGAETARILSQQAAVRVVINYRDKRRRAEKVATEIIAGGGDALALQADLTGPDDISRMLGEVKAAYGRIDVLILNASGGNGARC